jgi:hypothetical protein
MLCHKGNELGKNSNYESKKYLEKNTRKAFNRYSHVLGGVFDLLNGFWIEWLDLLTTYTHYSELQAITALYTYTSALSLHWS